MRDRGVSAGRPRPRHRPHLHRARARLPRRPARGRGDGARRPRLDRGRARAPDRRQRRGGRVGGRGAARASARPRPALRRRARRPARGRGRAAGAGERLGRSRDGRLHVGDHRSAEGRRAQPRQRARLAAGRDGRVALARATTCSCTGCRSRTSTGSAACRSGCWPASRAVLLERFDPERLCDAVQREGATVVFAVPAMYERLLGWEGFAGADLGSVRLWVSGSAPLAPGVAARLSERLGELPLERYGSTETGLSVSNLHDGPRRAGSVGLPLPGLELALSDDGEILLRGPQVFAALLGAAGHDGGRVHRRRLVPHGRPRPARRRRPRDHRAHQGADHQRRAQRLPARGRARARGAPVRGARRGRGRAVGALGRAGRRVRRARAGDVDEDALIGHVRERLSAHKCPKQIFEVDALPVGDTGKVRRAELVESAEERMKEDG